MKSIVKLVLFSLLHSVFFLVACQRRSLQKDINSNVKININWEAIINKPEHLKIIFFPSNGNQPLSYFIQPEGETIAVPTGEYYVLLYNWRSNKDSQSIIYKNIGSYSTFEAFTDSITGSIFEGEVLLQPDSLFSWSSGDHIISISENAVNFTYSNMRKQSDTITINTKPKSLVSHYRFFIPLKGIQYLKGIQAMISGVALSTNIYTKQTSSSDCNMSVTLSKAENGIYCDLSTFGLVTGKANILTLRFALCDGSILEKELDLSSEIKTGHVNDFTIPIEIPITECGGKTGGGTFTDPGIGKWKEQSETINM